MEAKAGAALLWDAAAGARRPAPWWRPLGRHTHLPRYPRWLGQFTGEQASTDPRRRTIDELKRRRRDSRPEVLCSSCAAGRPDCGWLAGSSPADEVTGGRRRRRLWQLPGCGGGARSERSLRRRPGRLCCAALRGARDSGIMDGWTPRTCSGCSWSTSPISPSSIHPYIHQMVDPKPGGTTPYLCSATGDDGHTSLEGKVTVGPLKLQRRNV